MAETQSEKSPLARFVLFMVCLAIAGSLVAGVHYFVVDKPAQDQQQAPSNKYCAPYEACQSNCPFGYGQCNCCSLWYNCGYNNCPHPQT